MNHSVSEELLSEMISPLTPLSPQNSHGQSFGDSKSDVPIDAFFDENDPQIEHDMIRIILQYLASHGYSTSAVVLQEESGLFTGDNSNRYPIIQSVSDNVIAGEWEKAESILREHSKPERLDKLLYLIYKQEFLEYISRSENQKALHFLYKFIKPLEAVCDEEHPGEFKELCYLLSLKSVQSSPYFSHWPGIEKSREILAATLSREFFDESVILEKPLPPNRLITLLKQAYSYQLSQSFSSIPSVTRVSSLLEDIHGYPLPTELHDTHQPVDGPIKGVAVVSDEVVMIAAKHTLYWWDDTTTTMKVVGRHNGILWDVKWNALTNEVVTGGADGMVKIWNYEKSGIPPIELSASQNDVYTVATHPMYGQLVASGCFDGSVQLFNAQQRSCLKKYAPHNSSVTAIAFNPAGNLLFSGGKDCRLTTWDIMSVCEVAVLDKSLKEITGIDTSECGNLLAVANRSNCNYIVDTRTNAIELSFRGIVNTRSNFLRLHFLGSNLLYSGSESGVVCIWDVRTQKIVSRLQAPRGCGSILDCMICKSTGKLFAGTERGDICVWSS